MGPSPGELIIVWGTFKNKTVSTCLDKKRGDHFCTEFVNHVLKNDDFTKLRTYYPGDYFKILAQGFKLFLFDVPII